jgi:hypothetical protein
MAKELGGPVLISISLEGIDDDTEHQGTESFVIQSMLTIVVN